MHGSWVLVRTRRDEQGRASWMLIKHRDEAAVPGNAGGPSDNDHSVASGRTMAEIAAGKGRLAAPFMTGSGAKAGAVWVSNRDDAPVPSPTLPHKAPAHAKRVARMSGVHARHNGTCPAAGPGPQVPVMCLQCWICPGCCRARHAPPPGRS